MPPEFQTHVLELPASAKGLRFDQALAAALPQYSRARLQRWIRAGAVRAEGRPIRARARVQGGEQLTVEAQFADAGNALAQPLALDIVHEDAALLVLNKPLVSLSRRCTIPARGTRASCGSCASSALSSV